MSERGDERKYLDQSGKDLDDTEDRIDELVVLLVAGALTPLMFEAAMQQIIEDCYVRQYALGRGLLSGEAIGESEIESVLRPLLDFQFEKLHDFTMEIIEGKLSAAQIAARAKMYISSARQAFERGRGIRLGWPELPAYPGDCSTLCCTRCRCNWSGYRVGNVWHFFWELDYLAEHCSSPLIDSEGRPIGCLERGALWNPLIVDVDSTPGV